MKARHAAPLRALTRLALVLLALLMAACANSSLVTGDERQPEPMRSSYESPPSSPGAVETQPPAPHRVKLKLKLVPVVETLSNPTHVTAAPNEPNRLYVVEQAGRIRIVANGKVLARPFLDIRDRVGSEFDEQGLLSMAFHPDYADNSLFYVNFTDRSGDTRVVEFRAATSSSPESVREVLFVDQPYANHNGGQLAFGPDGRLYVGMGDGGGGGDPDGRAQDLSSRLGKLLRLNVDEPGAQWEIVAFGLRNPWRFSFDRETGDLYLGDVGEKQWEEIDFVPRGESRLLNFGWDVYEGTHRFETEDINGAGELMQPIFEYDHGQGCSVNGGHVYRGKRIPAARGRYFFGDYCTGRIWSLIVKDGRATDVRIHSFKVGALSSFGEDAHGELLLVTHGGDTIYRLAQG
jgi:glucose/arabinose dehydrogenase